jgi:hypothetical protein
VEGNTRIESREKGTNGVVEGWKEGGGRRVAEVVVVVVGAVTKSVAW